MKPNETDKLKDLCQNWEEQGSATDFDSEKVWLAIENKQGKRRVFIPWYFSGVAVAVLLFLSVGFAYMMRENSNLQEQYHTNLAQLQKIQLAQPKVVVKKEVEIQYKTELKEVVKESPELQNEVKRLRLQLIEIEQEKALLRKQLAGVKTQISALKDSVKFLKAREVTPLFVENKKTPCQEEVALADIKVNIDETALADLPISKVVEKQESRKIKVIFREERKEVSKQQIPFSSIPIN
ncbi:MAG: hypothetical protein KGV44_15300 [Flavobacteriaceae bacterium]|nr:hypothetical protein [Flavobacteriaceae bacterium]